MKTPREILDKPNVHKAWLGLLTAFEELDERLLSASFVFADPEPQVTFCGIPVEVKFR